MRRTDDLVLTILACVASLLALSACTLPPSTPTPGGEGTPPASTPIPGGGGTPGPLPELNDKPPPVEITFNGCPPQGDGGDTGLNLLKNRVDEGSTYAVTFEAVAGLSWPKTIEQRWRAEWSAADTAAVAHYEGIPIAIEGYLADAKEQGPESTNCHGSDSANVDWHVWLTQAAGQDRSGSIVVETTPRVRPQHPGWSISRLKQIAQNRQHVRVSGWLMMDQEHPDQLGKTRGTLWEIHPITRIEVEQNGQWISLDSPALQP